MFDIHELTAAFLKARDELPDYHERKQRLIRVTSLRYDTKTPNLVHLISDHPEDHRLYRRVNASTLEEAARKILLFPPHLVYEATVTDEYRSVMLNFPMKKREKYGILDILEVDNNPAIMVLAPRDGVGFMFFKERLERTPNMDPDERLVVKVGMHIRALLMRLPPLPLNPETLEPIMADLVISPKYVNALRERVKISSNLPLKINRALAGLFGYISPLTDDEYEQMKQVTQQINEGNIMLTPAIQEQLNRIALSRVISRLVKDLDEQLPNVIDRDLLQYFMALPLNAERK